MKTFKSVDSVIKPSFARHLRACNNYSYALAKKLGTLTKKSGCDRIPLKVITIITKHEIWLKSPRKKNA